MQPRLQRWYRAHGSRQQPLRARQLVLATPVGPVIEHERNAARRVGARVRLGLGLLTILDAAFQCGSHPHYPSVGNWLDARSQIVVGYKRNNNKPIKLVGHREGGVTCVW